jgi:hypothetical protein
MYNSNIFILLHVTMVISLYVYKTFFCINLVGAENWYYPVWRRGRIPPPWPSKVVGADEKGSLKSETVKYGYESKGTWTQERLRWQVPAAYTEVRPVLHYYHEETAKKLGLMWFWFYTKLIFSNTILNICVCIVIILMFIFIPWYQVLYSR